MENAGLMGDILALLGAFFLGFVAGALFGPLRHFVVGLVRTPGKVFKGAQNAGARLLQAFRTSAAEEEMERPPGGLSGALAGAISGVLTLNVRRAETSFREGMAAFDQGEIDLARRRLSEAIFWDRRVELAPLHVLAHQRLGG